MEYINESGWIVENFYFENAARDDERTPDNSHPRADRDSLPK